MAVPGATTNNSQAPLKAIGVIVSESISAGLVVDHQLAGELLHYPAEAVAGDSGCALVELPTDSIVNAICELAVQAAKGQHASLTAIGVALPGLVRGGVVEEAPNLPQLKGARVQELLTQELAARGVAAPVAILNDADATAAGLAAQHGKLGHSIRVWTLGTGIGYGRYPFAEGVWEGGHSTVTLDDKENYCGCGGRGHLEGVMGHRAMRLRFLDREPEEVFEAANRHEHPDPRCVEFKHLWHKALAAATATSIHYGGAGKFFITGYNIRFLDMGLYKHYLGQMVKMGPLQCYSLEVVEDDPLSRIIGAAVAAEQAAGR